MNIPASTIIALTLVTGFVLFFVVRGLYRLINGPKDSSKPTKAAAKARREELAEKDEALEKFKQVHSAARDNRKQIAKEIKSDPQKATQALRSMMKR